MEKELYDALQVRFLKLRFRLVFLEDSHVPEDKVSAIRGGMGEMLLQMNCIRDRQCESCDFEAECIVQKTMYSKFEKTPAFVTTGGSIGYVLECGDRREYIRKGGTLQFSLLLFGKTAVYSHQFVRAFLKMGRRTGLGGGHARFEVAGIYDTAGQPVLRDGTVNMGKHSVQALYDYLAARKFPAGVNTRGMEMVFTTPLSLKYRNEFQQEFHLGIILNAAARRIYMLNCFEGIESGLYDRYNGREETLPAFLAQEHWLARVSRYSARKGTKMILRGLRGRALLPELPEELLQILLVGELIHIGKNTSFGFGKYFIRSGIAE